MLKYILLFYYLITLSNLQAQEIKKPIEGNYKKKIAPNNCLVQAKIVKIVPAWKRASKHTCKKSPCLVYIKIIKVEKYGSSFPAHFSEDEKVKVHFIYSTKPSKQVYPDKNIKLPGIKKGDFFKAQINAKKQLGSNSSVFTIYKYQLM